MGFAREDRSLSAASGVGIPRQCRVARNSRPNVPYSGDMRQIAVCCVRQRSSYWPPSPAVLPVFGLTKCSLPQAGQVTPTRHRRPLRTRRPRRCLALGSLWRGTDRETPSCWKPRGTRSHNAIQEISVAAPFFAIPFAPCAPWPLVRPQTGAHSNAPVAADALAAGPLYGLALFIYSHHNYSREQHRGERRLEPTCHHQHAAGR
jgi:hypothetical protein